MADYQISGKGEYFRCVVSEFCASAILISTRSREAEVNYIRHNWKCGFAAVVISYAKLYKKFWSSVNQ